MNALLVEDNPMQAKIACAILSSMGFEVAHTATGEEAISLFTANTYQLVIMDIGLDGALSGDAATAEIRKIEAANHRGHCPIFAVTAHVSDDAIAQYHQAGLDEVFQKPMRKELLQEAFDHFKV